MNKKEKEAEVLRIEYWRSQKLFPIIRKLPVSGNWPTLGRFWPVVWVVARRTHCISVNLLYKYRLTTGSIPSHQRVIGQSKRNKFLFDVRVNADAHAYRISQ